MGRLRILLIIIFTLINSAVLYPADKREKEVYFRVSRVVDGDTFWIENGTSKGLKVRLIGIDAPESRKTGYKETGYYGREASDYLTKLIGNKRVRLVYDVGHYDRYGRTLAYVYLENGLFVNAELVKNGYATIMTVPPNVRYANTFLKLERKARNQKRGMWGVKYH